MIEELAKSLLRDLRTLLPTRTDELPEQEVKLLLESALRKLNLVTREEFDAQQAVLLRTRAKLEQLEQQLAQWEQQQP